MNRRELRYLNVFLFVLFICSAALVLASTGCAHTVTTVDPVTGATVVKQQTLPPVEQARLGYENTATAYKIAKKAVETLRRDGLVKDIDWQSYLTIKRHVRETIPSIDFALKTWKRTTVKPINYDDLVTQLIGAVQTLQTIQAKSTVATGGVK